MKITTTSIDRFREAMQHGIALISEAARIYVEAIDSNPNARNEFLKACPEMSQQTFNGLEAVGRGMLDKRLLYATNASFSQLKRLPLSQQRAALDNGVEVLLADGDRIMIKTEDLTPLQRSQVFGGDRIRTLSEQRAWMESRSREIIIENEVPAYEVKRGKLHIYKPCKLSAKELAVIMSEVI